MQFETSHLWIYCSVCSILFVGCSPKCGGIYDRVFILTSFVIFHSFILSDVAAVNGVLQFFLVSVCDLLVLI